MFSSSTLHSSSVSSAQLLIPFVCIRLCQFRSLFECLLSLFPNSSILSSLKVPGGVGPMTIAMLLRNTINGTIRSAIEAQAAASKWACECFLKCTSDARALWHLLLIWSSIKDLNKHHFHVITKFIVEGLVFIKQNVNIILEHGYFFIESLRFLNYHRLTGTGVELQYKIKMTKIVAVASSRVM